MKRIDSCPICSKSTFSPFLECKDYTVSLDTFSIVKCGNCDFAFTNPIPEDSKIGSYYESEKYISHSNTSKGIVNRLYQLVRNYTLKKKINLLQSLSGNKDLLDIGSGTGEFINQAQDYNFKVKGIEPSETARKKGEENYGLLANEEKAINRFSDQKFGFITMWHVLEHVYHLNDRIAEIYRILKDDGYVIIAVPNHTSYDAKHYKEFWAAYDLPRHLYHFSPNTIEKLFQKHHFTLHKTIPMKFDSFYVSMLSEKYKTGKSNLMKAFWIGLKSNLKANNSSTFSSQIYIFRKTKI